MAKLKLTGKELRKIGYPEGLVLSIAMSVMEKTFSIFPTKKHWRY